MRSGKRSIATLDRMSIQPLSDQLEMIQDDPESVNRQATFRDYIQHIGAEVIVSEPLETSEQLSRIAKQLRSSYTDMLERGEAVLDPEAFQVLGSHLRWQKVSKYQLGLNYMASETKI